LWLKIPILGNFREIEILNTHISYVGDLQLSVGKMRLPATPRFIFYLFYFLTHDVALLSVPWPLALVTARFGTNYCVATALFKTRRCHFSLETCN